MTTYELSENQFDELRNNYFWSDDAQPKTTATGDQATAPEELADELIHQYYSGICFVPDDFACTAHRIPAPDGKKCPRCAGALFLSDNPEYQYQCFDCDEDFYSIEVD